MSKVELKANLLSSNPSGRGLDGHVVISHWYTSTKRIKKCNS